MKKILSLFLIVSICLCLSGCTIIHKVETAFDEIESDNDYVDNMCYEIVRCFDERDTTSLKDLFSLNICDEYDLDSQIEYAFSLYKGISESYYVTQKSWAGGYKDGIFYDKHFTPVIKEIVTDEGETYSINYLTYYIYEEDKGEIGITALGLVDESGKEIARIGKE